MTPTRAANIFALSASASTPRLQITKKRKPEFFRIAGNAQRSVRGAIGRCNRSRHRRGRVGGAENGPIHRRLRQRSDGQRPDERRPLAGACAHHRRPVFRPGRSRHIRRAGPRHGEGPVSGAWQCALRGDRRTAGIVLRIGRAGRAHRPLRPQDGLSMEPPALWLRHHRLRFFAELLLAGRAALHRRTGTWYRDRSGFCLRRRVLAEERARPQHVARPSRRRRAALAGGDHIRARLPGFARLAWHFRARRRLRADRLGAALQPARNRRAGSPRTAKARRRSKFCPSSGSPDRPPASRSRRRRRAIQRAIRSWWCSRRIASAC